MVLKKLKMHEIVGQVKPNCYVYSFYISSYRNGLLLLRLINGFETRLICRFNILTCNSRIGGIYVLVMLLSLTTGFIGDFLLLVFMIVNLGGSAGTYPLDTGPAISTKLFINLYHILLV